MSSLLERSDQFGLQNRHTSIMIDGPDVVELKWPLISELHQRGHPLECEEAEEPGIVLWVRLSLCWYRCFMFPPPRLLPPAAAAEGVPDPHVPMFSFLLSNRRLIGFIG